MAISIIIRVFVGGQYQSTVTLYQTRSIFKFLYENSLRTMKFILTKRTHFTVVYLFWGIKGSLFIMGNDNRFSS